LEKAGGFLGGNNSFLKIIVNLQNYYNLFRQVVIANKITSATIESENPEQLRQEILRLENKLKQTNKKIRQSFESQNPGALNNYREAKRQRLVIERTIEALRQRIGQNGE
jgi:hypothetical protein